MSSDRPERRVRRHIVFILMSCIAALIIPSFDTRRNYSSEWNEVFAWSAGEPFDASKWILERGFLRNEEEQYYTGGAPANFEETPEGLKLVGRSERIVNAAYRKGTGDWRVSRAEGRYTSTSLLSKDSWQNVRIEIVANVKGGKGAWPAIWLRSPNTHGFAEVDMMEQLGREPDIVHSTVHFGASANDRDVKTADRTISGLQGKDVLYAAELTPGRLTVSINRVPMLKLDRRLKSGKVQPLQQPFNLIINLALGGAWSGPIDETSLPATMTIKSIRIWDWQPPSAAASINAERSKG